MQRSRFTGQQIAFACQQTEQGTQVGEVALNKHMITLGTGFLSALEIERDFLYTSEQFGKRQKTIVLVFAGRANLTW